MEKFPLKIKSIYCEEIIVDLLTPLAAFLKLKNLKAFALLESVEKGETLARYSYLALQPLARLKLTSRNLWFNRQIIARGRQQILLWLKKLFELKQFGGAINADFCGGWIGYLGYEFAALAGITGLKRKSYPLKVPLGYLFLPQALLIFDHLTHRCQIVVVQTENNDPVKIAAAIRRAISRRSIPPLSDNKKRVLVEPAANYSSEDFLKKVELLKEHIAAGDIIQAVISRQFRASCSASPLEIYRALRIINPSPYMFYLNCGNFFLIGSSPESHLKVVGDKALVRPIAGTRRRGKDKEEDQLLETELRGDEKELAEHTMLIDLARNDLGRICQPGSIEVLNSFSIERYSHVMHLVSTVAGRLEEGKSPFDALLATFPAGTVSGAPKIRAMELIDSLEPTARGPYAGVVGYFSLNGNCDFCIAIRMLLYQRGKVLLQAGAGIVDGSQPRSELAEVQKKAEVLWQAVKDAAKGGEKR